VFLAQWGEAYDQEGAKSWVYVLQQQSRYPLNILPSPDVNVRPWLLIFFCISAAGAFSVFAYIAVGYYASLQASRSLFVSMLQRLVRTPSRFLDVTPIGRILNRFTSGN
jgi:ABC-type multidrug transport system fused ATPase/permease subunit